MITSAKPLKDTDTVLLRQVSFLTLDGNTEIEFTPTLFQNTYVSKDDHNKYGKVETYSDHKSKFYLKQFRGGRPGELLVDPHGMMAKAEDLSAYVTQRGHRFCEYVQVDENIYDCYVQYLKTRDSRYFRTCEKSLLDKVL